MASADGILPLSGTPRRSIPVGHCERGSSSTPARSRRPRAVVTAVSGISVGNQVPAQESQRPQSAAVSSSSARCRNAIRQPSVAW